MDKSFSLTFVWSFGLTKCNTFFLLINHRPYFQSFNIDDSIPPCFKSEKEKVGVRICRNILTNQNIRNY